MWKWEAVRAGTRWRNCGKGGTGNGRMGNIGEVNDAERGKVRIEEYLFA
jgi:hypothetical protein